MVAPTAYWTTLLMSICVLVEARVGSVAASNQTAASGLSKEMSYTQNSFCRQNNCVNPIFPGLNDLPRLEALTWQCSSASVVRDHMDFCKDVVNYDPALPSPIQKAKPVNELVKAQEDAAMTMYFYHLSGMGYDSWDHRTPSLSDSDCVKSVWKMTCYTYFPRAEAGCKPNEQSMYKRPCSSCCQNYIQQCGIECCDESVQCVFAHTKYDSTGKLSVLQTGYVGQSGPSAACTGSARRSFSFPLALLLGIFGFQWMSASASAEHAAHREAKNESQCRSIRTRDVSRWFMLCLVVVMALSLQGCDVDIPSHPVGNWRAARNYLSAFKYVPPGKGSKDAVLNSCSEDKISPAQRCNGRGYCRSFTKNSLAAQQQDPLSFCQCEVEWADPECGTKRKSQIVTFFLSLFLGPFGADLFYLGFPFWGLLKLLTLGGLGFWWLIDIVRTGAGPVYAYNFRTANDLPHWVANLIVIFLVLVIGFAVAIITYDSYRKQKRRDIANLSYSEESRHFKQNQEEMNQLDGPRYRTRNNLPGEQIIDGRPGWSGYGATLPAPLPNAQAPYATPAA